MTTVHTVMYLNHHKKKRESNARVNHPADEVRAAHPRSLQNYSRRRKAKQVTKRRRTRKTRISCPRTYPLVPMTMTAAKTTLLRLPRPSASVLYCTMKAAPPFIRQ